MDEVPEVPAFKATKAQKIQVECYVADGMSEDEIAIALGITKQTLIRHFWLGLSRGAVRQRAKLLDLMHETAKGGKGNATVQKKLLERMNLAAAEKEVVPERPRAKIKKLGKKEQANLDAETASDGTDWGDDLSVTAH